MRLVVGHAVHETRRRGVIGLDVGEPNTEAFWTEFVRGGVARGVVGVQLAISDASAASGTAPVLASAQESLARIVRSACTRTRFRPRTRSGGRRRLLDYISGYHSSQGGRRSLCAHAVATRVAPKRGSRQVSMLDLEVPAL